jgi:hypothetical protein
MQMAGFVQGKLSMTFRVDQMTLDEKRIVWKQLLGMHTLSTIAKPYRLSTLTRLVVIVRNANNIKFKMQ